MNFKQANKELFFHNQRKRNAEQHVSDAGLREIEIFDGILMDHSDLIKHFSCPEIAPVFLEDRLRIAGKEYLYSDLSSMTIDVGKSFSFGKKETGIYFSDIYACICFGLFAYASEICDYNSDKDAFENILYDFYQQHEIFDLYDKEKADKLCDTFYDDINDIVRGNISDDIMIRNIQLQYGLRTKQARFHEAKINGFGNVVVQMWWIARLKPQIFWELFFKLLNAGILASFVVPNSALTSDVPDEINHLKSQIAYANAAYGVLGKITDCNAFCRCIIDLLCHLLCKDFYKEKSPKYKGKSSSLSFLFEHENFDEIYIRAMWSTIGEDSFADLLQGKLKNDSMCPTHSGIILNFTKDKRKGNPFCKEILEDQILTQYMFKIPVTEEDKIHEYAMWLHDRIFSITSIIESQNVIMDNQKTKLPDLVKKEVKTVQKEDAQKYITEKESLEQKYKTLLKEEKDKNAELLQTVQKVQSDKKTAYLQEQIQKLTAENETLQKANAMLKEKVEKIRQENTGLKEKQQVITDIQNAEEELNREMTLEDKIEAINAFDIVIVGGRYDLYQKLQKMGLTSFVQLQMNENKKRTLPNADLYVEMTKFMSHSLDEYTKAIYKNNAECLYFNGTNAENLICDIYDQLNRMCG